MIGPVSQPKRRKKKVIKGKKANFKARSALKALKESPRFTRIKSQSAQKQPRRR